MLYETNNENGRIILSREAAAEIVADEIEQLRGRVWAANEKGVISNFKNHFSGKTPADDIEVFWDGKGICVRACIVIRFGVSIRTVTEQLIADIRAALTACTQLPVSSVVLVVTGTLSKHIARRNIEIHG